MELLAQETDDRPETRPGAGVAEAARPGTTRGVESPPEARVGKVLEVASRHVAFATSVPGHVAFTTCSVRDRGTRPCSEIYMESPPEVPEVPYHVAFTTAVLYLKVLAWRIRITWQQVSSILQEQELQKYLK